MTRIDLMGHKYGRLLVQGYSHKGNSGHYWRCLCDCGNANTVLVANLRGEKVVSCGCAKTESTKQRFTTHGKTKTKTYKVWNSMMERCYSNNHRSYPNYGGRGISACERWFSFENFLVDMGEQPTGFTIERIDVNGNYEPSNCKWASYKEQANNRRNTHYLTFNGVTLSIYLWAERLGMNPRTITSRVHRGWPIDKILDASPKPLRGRHAIKNNLTKG